MRPIADVMHAWPNFLRSLPALKHLRIEFEDPYLKQMAPPKLNPLNLADFAHIPCLNICIKQDLVIAIQGGSWQLLHVELWYGSSVSIPDVQSLLKSVSVFVITISGENMKSMARLKEACQSLHVPLYEQEHCKLGRTTISHDERFVKVRNVDNSALKGSWPADPIATTFKQLQAAV